MKLIKSCIKSLLVISIFLISLEIDCPVNILSTDLVYSLICSFEMEPPYEKQAVLFELLNDVNEKCWAGSFSFWTEQKMMIYKYGLVLTGGQIASAEQVDCLISTAVLSSEKFYPAFQLAVYGDKTPKEAIQVAIAEAFGRA